MLIVAITLFKNNFKDKGQCFPDIAEDHFIINIYKEDKQKLQDEIIEEKLDKEIETKLTKRIEKNNELINKVNNNCNSEIEMTNTVE